MWFMALTAGQDYQWLLPLQLAQYGRWAVVMVVVPQSLRRDWGKKLDDIHLELPGYSQCSENLGLFYNLGEFPGSQVQQRG